MAAARSDAVRNRERLVAVAREAFAGDDPVTLEAVARAAGVGIGTLYRHFPTRDALVEAVYRSELERLAASGPELARRHPPEHALRLWTQRLARYVAAKRDLATALRPLYADGTVTVSEARARLGEGLAPILDAGAAAGTLRADIVPADVVAQLVGIFVAASDDAQITRLVDLLLDGLRPQP